MGRDYPDWGGTYNAGQFYPLFDMAELAARLGSLITYDRRGALLWQYGFEHGIGDVGPATTGAGSAVNLSSTIWEIPPFSCILQSGTADGATAGIDRRMSIPQALRVGFQASLRASANVSKIYHYLYHYDGSTQWRSYLLADLDAGTLAVRTQEEGEKVLDDAFPDLTTGYYFSHFKLVADLADHSLVRALVDENEYDLSAYTMLSLADASAPHIRARVVNLGHNLVAAALNVDNLIITAAEP